MKKAATTNPLKIVFLLPSLSAGGAERVLITLMNGLNRRKFTPSLISVMSNIDLHDLLAPETPAKVLRAHSLWRGLPALWRTLKQEKPDIIVSTMAHMNFSVLLLRPFLPRTKIIVREAITPSFFFRTNPRKAWLIRLAYKLLYRHADRVISPSVQIIHELRNISGLENINYDLLYNPVSLEAIESSLSSPPPWNDRPSDIHFVASGRLHPQKGFDRLIEALAHFRPSFSWRLHILGQGDQEETLKSLIDNHHLSEHITLEGHKKEPWAYYRWADALLLPSRWEGLPNVALESLACGTPVIASAEAGAIHEIADLAEKKAVCLTQTMDGFIKLMEKVIPNDTQKKTFLPAAFQEDYILEKFQRILEEA